MVKKLFIFAILLILISGCTPNLPLSDEEFEIAKRSVQCFYIQRLKNKCWFDNKVQLMDFYSVESDDEEIESYTVVMKFSPFNCQDRPPELEHCSKMYITSPMETCSFIDSRQIPCDWNISGWDAPIPLRIE